MEPCRAAEDISPRGDQLLPLISQGEEGQWTAELCFGQFVAWPGKLPSLSATRLLLYAWDASKHTITGLSWPWACAKSANYNSTSEFSIFILRIPLKDTGTRHPRYKEFRDPDGEAPWIGSHWSKYVVEYLVVVRSFLTQFLIPKSAWNGWQRMGFFRSFHRAGVSLLRNSSRSYFGFCFSLYMAFLILQGFIAWWKTF